MLRALCSGIGGGGWENTRAPHGVPAAASLLKHGSKPTFAVSFAESLSSFQTALVLIRIPA